MNRAEPVAAVSIEIADAASLDAAMGALTTLLRECVDGGGSVGFLAPLAAEEAADFWRVHVRPGVLAGARALLVAKIAGEVAGAAQLDCDTPTNQPHRADVAKLMVRPAHRRRGVARSLMTALEAEARRRGRWLLTLDTRVDDHAAPLYRALGYAEVGVIPDYAVNPDGRGRHGTLIMYKRLGPGEARSIG